MMDQSNIQTSTEKIVMRRVRTTHTLRPLLSSTAASVAVLIAALWGIGREVWVARVFQNEPSITNFSAVTHFYFLAFMDTRIVVQILTILVIAAFVWFVRNALRSLPLGMQYA